MQELPEALQSIVDPKSYHCHVWFYTVHHHELALRVYKPPFDSGETFFIIFSMVSFFEGPMHSWDGADFRIGTFEEYREVIRTSVPNPLQIETELQFYYEHFPLFVIDRPGLRVRIVAARNVHRTTEDIDVIPTQHSSDATQ